MPEPVQDIWDTGRAYERYVGRWSRRVARGFLEWLGAPVGLVWADVGCGTGALSNTILSLAQPDTVYAIDRSKAFLAGAHHTIADERMRCMQADATALPLASAACDVSVSGLVLNFVPDPGAMVREMVRVTRPQGTVAVYVWDYASGMQMLRHFWDAVIEVAPQDHGYDEGVRFPLCQPEPLTMLFRAAGLHALAVRAIEITTYFRNFEEYWEPFLGKQGPAPSYLATLDAERRERIRALLHARLVRTADGSITLPARAWAVQGTV